MGTYENTLSEYAKKKRQICGTYENPGEPPQGVVVKKVK